MQRIARLIRNGICIAGLLLAMGMGAAFGETGRVVDEIAVYLGVVPAELVQERHPQVHEEVEMHGSIPERAHRYHLMVALFDQVSGERIGDADVAATVAPVGLGGTRRVLDLMIVADAPTYGRYFRMPQAGSYRIDLEIRRPDVAEATNVRFEYERP